MLGKLFVWALLAPVWLLQGYLVQYLVWVRESEKSEDTRGMYILFLQDNKSAERSAALASGRWSVHQLAIATGEHLSFRITATS
jgi:hypothetical protein